jgi:hypothetical protein
VLKSDRIDVLVENEGNRDDEVKDVKALGAKVVRQNFNGVRDDERREGQTEYQKKWESANLTLCIKPNIDVLISCVEEEDKCNHRVRCGRILSLHELLHANSLECEE